MHLKRMAEDAKNLHLKMNEHSGREANMEVMDQFTLLVILLLLITGIYSKDAK